MKSFRPLADPSRLWGANATTAEELRSHPRRVASDLLRLFLANRTPITLWGPVGARKTRTIEAFCTETDEEGIPYQVVTIQPSTVDPTVIHGLYYTSQQKDGSTLMLRSVPEIAQRIDDYYRLNSGLTILFMDEMTTCLPAAQHALLGLLTHGKYGDLDISDYITIAMAANPEGTVSTVNELGEQVMNRGGHIAWFGDVDLFLEDWSSGFGNPDLRPLDTIKWYIEQLLMQAPEDAFRNPDNWDPDSLVPYDHMEHTERSTTELARMITLVNEVFHDKPDFIRHAYIVECTRALMGRDWADRMAVVTSMERDLVSSDAIITKVRGAGITLFSLRDELPDDLHDLPSGEPMRQDQEIAIMESLLNRVYKEGVFDGDAHLAAWAFVVTGDTQSQILIHHAAINELLNMTQTLIQSGFLSKNSAIPTFLTREFREMLKSSLRQSATAS